MTNTKKKKLIIEYLLENLDTSYADDIDAKTVLESEGFDTSDGVSGVWVDCELNDIDIIAMKSVPQTDGSELVIAKTDLIYEYTATIQAGDWDDFPATEGVASMRDHVFKDFFVLICDGYIGKCSDSIGIMGGLYV